MGYWFKPAANKPIVPFSLYNTPPRPPKDPTSMYMPLRKRMRHQDLAIAAAARAPANPCPDDAFAFLMDYGTGKSQTILDEWGMMATSGGPQDFLCVAPAGSYRNWFEDKNELQRAEISYMDPALRVRTAVLGWSKSQSTEYRRRVERFLRVTDRPRALFANVEALSTMQRARDLVTEFVGQRLCYGVIDESTTIKGGSQRTKFLTRLGENMAVRRIATGLLTPNGPTDAFWQFEFLSWRIIGCRSWFSFRNRYCVTRRIKVQGETDEKGEKKTRDVEVIVGYRNLEQLHARLAPYNFRVLKSECLDLEPKKYVAWEIEHTEEQARIYNEIRENATAMLESGSWVNAERVMTQVMILHQINCGHVTDEDGKVYDVPSNRIPELIQILGAHRGKAVIWCPYRRPIPKIAEALEREFGKRPAQFHGGNRDSRAEEERRFLSDPDCIHMIASQGAAGRGNTWTVADLEIYFANNYDLEQRYNSEDRLHRKGQTNRVTVVDMMVPGTVDTKIVRALRKKITMATTMTGEEAREWLI